ncbi:MAG: bifunctional [glutamine synthetase] adenylyltransferase/[glutamine synthetase]-adenylyl-L-tyrosine phosphorylase [Pseudomonadota bacterium]
MRRAPVPYDPAAGTAALAGLGAPFDAGPARALVLGAAGSSPFLARLIAVHSAWLTEAATETPTAALERLLADAAAAVAAAPGDRATMMQALRRLRARAALLIALADLGGAADLAETTAALTRLAEGALAIALPPILSAEIARGRLPGIADPADTGLVILGMGKLGAGELNYSSDIDLICLFDQERYAPADEADARSGLIRATRALVEVLSAQTGDGAVFRTDLRLRPNPSTTPVCLSMAAAERYYETEGRTWERAAHIKARTVAGDAAAGAAYLQRLAPFVWRRSLDFYALDEVHGLLLAIRRGAGAHAPPAPADVPGIDIKRAPGGIREIEFLAQTRQLILGGRDARLRARGTVQALEALAGAGAIDGAAAAQLAGDYIAHRTVEHRLQMVEDAQTHSIPTGTEARARAAALAGHGDPARWEREIAMRLTRVHDIVSGFFPTQGRRGERSRPAPPAAVHGAAEALAARGFARADDTARTLARWRDGGVAATRGERARQLYAALEPTIVEGLAAAANPDDALAAFERFITGLPAGVQVFSLLSANPGLMRLLIDVMAASPRLAHYLGRQSAALEALLDRDFFAPPPDTAAQVRALSRALAGTADHEGALNRARAWARDETFRVGVQVLRGRLGAPEAGAAFSAIAEACLRELTPRAAASVAERHGPPPGLGMVVLALGKLGTREMTAGSDLDLIIVYDAAGAAASDGPRPLAPSAYYPRLTKALVASLAAPTAEGRLYDVDMRLRPSGRAGPVAVSADGFAAYHAGEAEVWEHLALGRARVVAWTDGAEALGARVRKTIDRALAARAATAEARAATAVAAAAMHDKLVEAHAAERTNPWSLKHTAGGVMEIEFLAQTGALLTGAGMGRPAVETLARLAEAGWLPGAAARTLIEALALMQRLQQVERAALDQQGPPERFGPCLRMVLSATAGEPDFERVTERLAEVQARAAEIVSERFAVLARSA